MSDRFGGQYRGKIAVISGASSGLGRQLTLDLAAAGATVVGVARREERLKELAIELDVMAAEYATYVCDVADVSTWLSVLGDVEHVRGRIDILVNNAASDPGVRLRSISVGDFERTFATNFFGPVASTLAVIPGMLDRGEGVIANVSSDAGRLASPGPGAYASSKAALSTFTESVSFRVAPHGVRMHVVYPGWMPTAMGREALTQGLRSPPWFARRTEADVSKLVLSRLGGESVFISASRVINWAEGLRLLTPRLYRRYRSRW